MYKSLHIMKLIADCIQNNLSISMERRRLFKFFFILILSFQLLNFAKTQGWNQNAQIRTGIQQIFPTPLRPTPFFRSTDIPISYSIVFVGALTSTRSAGVGIVGFEAEITYDYSLNTTVENFTMTGLRITGKVYGDTVITYYSVNYIAVGITPNFLQVQFNCHLCTNLRYGQGYRTETRTGSTFFIGYAKLFSTVYLAGFSVFNKDGLTYNLEAYVDIPTGTNTLNYLFSTTQNNTVTEICYTTIIFCQIITKTQYYDWGQSGRVTLSNNQNPSIFPFPAKPDYTDQNQMFFGMSTFSLSRASRRVFNLQTDQYNNLNNQFRTNEGTHSVGVDFFWYALRSCNNSHQWFNVYQMDCQNNCNGGQSTTVFNGTTYTIYQTNPGSFCYSCHYSCLTCNGAHINQCQTCDSLLSRVSPPVSNTCSCLSSFIQVGVPLCYPCQNYIAGCDTCITTSICTACFPGFILQPSGICQCTTGYLVSGICTNVTGCTGLVQYGGTIYCISCNSTLHFQLNNQFLCECTSGYYMNSNQVCYSKCGDGKHIAQQFCDDGNLIEGDGCSSFCKIQQNWYCQNGSNTTASICYINELMQMSIRYVRRITSMNRMQVGIKIYPYFSQLSLTNFKQYITHNVPSTDFNATFIDGQLVLEFDYNKTIEGQFYDLNLTLDPKYFYNKSLSIKIPTSGMNAKLTYDSANQINYPMEIIVIILDVLAIIVLFISSISERMIGIEMIQTIQTVLYAQAVMKTTPSSLSPLQMLRYSSGYNEIHKIDYGRTYTFAFSLSSLGLQKQFLLSYNIMFILLMVVIVCCLLLKAKQLYHQNKIGQFVKQEDEGKNKKKFDKVSKIYNFIFERILFIVVFMCMYLIVFAIMLQLTDMSGQYKVLSKQFNLLGSIIAISILATMICAVILNGCFPGVLLFPMLMKQYYPPIYFIYQSTFIFLLAFDYTQEYILYILAAMSFIFMVYNMLHRPYPEKFHTFVLIFHQILIIGVIGIYIFQNLSKPAENETLYKILNGVIIALLYVVVGLNAYRLYKYYMFMKNNNWDQYGNQEEGKEVGNRYDDSYYYNQLKTPKTMKKNVDKQYDVEPDDRRLKESKEKEREKDLAKKRKQRQQIEMQPYKKTSNSKSKAKPNQDESAMNWNYNKLADEEPNQNKKNDKNNDKENDRIQYTRRDVAPDTSREKPLNKSKTKDNLNNTKNNGDDNDNDGENQDNNNKSKNYDEQFTMKQPNSKNKGNENNDNEDEFDNPYDQDGYAKKTPKSSKQMEEDPLQAIKRRLKKDFNSKIQTSTLKQS